MIDATAPVHLMLPRFHQGGYAEYACNLDGTRGPGVVPMRQRTLNPGEATCPDCKEAIDAGHTRPRGGVYRHGVRDA